MNHRRKVVCAVIEREGLILAARRKPEQSNGGLWEFPGGKVRRAESPPEALQREILEELDVAVAILRDLPAVEWDYPRISIELIPFVCAMDAGAKPRLLAHAEIGFFTPDDATALAWAPADRMVFRQYIAAKDCSYGSSGT